MKEVDLGRSKESSLSSSNPVLFIAVFGYVSLPEVSSQKGSLYYFQILFWISMMGLLPVPSPGLTPIVFVSVSTADVFLLHILNTDLT